MKTFYMVYVQGGENPRYIHTEYHSAAAEAERLTVLTEKDSFILKAVAKCSPAPRITWEPQEITEE